MTPAAFKAARLSLGLTAAQAAPLFGLGDPARIFNIEAANSTAVPAWHGLLMQSYIAGYRPADWSPHAAIPRWSLRNPASPDRTRGHENMTPQYEQSYGRAWRDLRLRELSPPGPNPFGAGRPASDKSPVLALFRPGVRLSIADVAKTLAVNRHAARDALSILNRDGAIYVCGKASYGANIYTAPDRRTDDEKLLHTLRDGRERLASEIAALTGRTACEVSKSMERLAASRNVVARRMPGTWANMHGYRLA